MLKKYLIAAALMYTSQVFAQQAVNYVRTWGARIPITDASTMATRPVTEVIQTTAFVDGLGRPLQMVAKQGSLFTKLGANTFGDMVSTFEYDEFGREVKKYLPYATATTDGALKANPLTEQNSFYSSQLTGQGETFFYSNSTIEASPLNRPTKSYAPGNNWIGASRGVGMQYLNNTIADDIKKWQVNGAGSYAVNGAYTDGLLTEMHTTDEHGNQVVEYNDIEGKVILKKVQAAAVINDNYTGWLCTYYVYDMYNNLRLVIQPRGVTKLIENGWVLNSTILDELCFRYEYDGKNRMSIKKVPGAAEVYIVYDKWDRLVLTQDGNLKSQNKWVFTKYDYLSRPVLTGFYIDANYIGQVSMQNYADLVMYSNTSALFESTNTSSIGYTTTVSFPSLSSPQLLTITFYDNYNWAGNYNITYATKNISNDGLFYSTGAPLYAQPLAQSSKTKGMITGTVTYVLNSATNQKLVTSVFYDDRGRAIQSKADNITGGIDITTTQYNFSGQPLMSLLQQEKANAPNAQTVKVITKLSYDDLGRLKDIKKTVTQTIGTVTIPATPVERTIVKNEYDKLGQLVRKVLAPEYNSNAGLEKLEYEYNIRGWLTGFNKDYVSGANTTSYFGMELAYDKTNTAVSGTNYAAAQYNGNIAGTIWKSKGDAVNRQYDFGYDKVNRLLKGDFKQRNSDNAWGYNEVNYSIKMGDGTENGTAYDENGNIKRMQQWGLKINSSTQIDDLTYEYGSTGISNKLLKVTDAFTDAVTKLGDFKDGINTGDDYVYDVNGNLNLDNNKDILSITYNHLNLPEVIAVKAPSNWINGSRTITYTYDAAGNKLKKLVYESMGPGANRAITTTYINGFVYDTKLTNQGGSPEADDHTDMLQFIPQEEGRVRYKPAVGSIPADFTYDYFIKDHLGNTRVVLTEELQQDKYPVASLEDAKLATEQNYYDINLAQVVPKSEATGITEYINDNGIGNNPTDAAFSAANSTKLYKLNSNTAKTGLGITLKVMAGDKIDVFGKSYYFTNTSGTGGNSTIPVMDLLTAFLNAPAAAATTAGHGAVTPAIINTPTGINGINSMMTQQGNQSNAAPDKPRAFINVIFFDEQFKTYDGGFSISMVGNNSEVKNHYSELQNLMANKSGYVYIYCSNQSPVNVFFDNLQVTHTRGALLSEDHYYPFGGRLFNLCSQSAGKMENRYKFNGGTELNNDFDITLYETHCRLYDPQIGRFWQVDELAEANWEMSPYNFALNNPISFNDPLGLQEEKKPEPEKPVTTEKTNMQGVTVYGKVKKWTFNQVQDAYYKFQKEGTNISNLRDGTWKRQLEWYDDRAKYLTKYHAGVKQDGLMLLEGMSWMFPAGQITKLRYLKPAIALFKMKRGGIVLKVASNFGNELGKNILAKNGNIGNVDWNDVIVNTATANFNIFGKIIAKTWNSATDVSYLGGNESIFNQGKTYTSAGIDLLFNSVKLGAKSLAEPGQSKDAVNVFEILMDQSKNGVKDVIK